jgi:hypothetical protein
MQSVHGEYNDARMVLTSGTKLGPYEIQSSLGAGRDRVVVCPHIS